MDYSHWIQGPGLEHSQAQPHEPTSSLDDWAKQRPASSSQQQPMSSSSSSLGIDISDFMAEPAASSSNQIFPYVPYSPPPTYNSFGLHAPYNAMSYGSWNNQPPLSTYSSLNGATTSTPTASSSSAPQLNSSSMVIDPALTTLNGTSSHSYSQPSNFNRQSTFQNSFSMHYQPPSAPATQGTLSPHSLHAPSPTSSSSLMAAIPAQFYSIPTQQQQRPPPPPPETPTISPQERKQQLVAAIKPLLLASAFTGAQAVQTLVQRINDHGPQDVDNATRLEIVTKIRDGAGNPYFRAWAENSTAMDITREWLKAAATATTDDPLVETVMPLLHIIDRLPLNLDSLKASKLGKIVVKLVKDPPTPAIKDMASNIERRWRKMVITDSGAKTSDGNGPEAKKRKSTDAPTSKAAPPLKKVASTSATSGKPKVLVKKEIKPTVPVKEVKSDISFFSAPKAKPKLPSFKKAPPAPVKQDTNVAQPSSIDPFQEALKSMAKYKRDSPAAPTPPPTTTSTPPQGSAVVQGKKKKSVTWAPDASLESVRLIDRAIYDDDPVERSHGYNFRALDRGEGAALHAPLFEETTDWYEPLTIQLIDIDERPRGLESVEKVTQEVREQTALGAAYMMPSHIPDSPAEPSQVISEEEIDKEVHIMSMGPQLDFDWQQSQTPPAGTGPMSSVAELVAQLGGAIPNGGAQFDHMNVDPTIANAAIASMQSLSQEQLQQVLQSLTPAAFGAAQQMPPQQQPLQQAQAYNLDPNSNWGQPNADFNMNNINGMMNQGYQDESSHDRWGARTPGRGRGRGRGGHDVGGGGFRGSRRKPCIFFQTGRCKYGDQCDFAHEMAPS